MLENLNVLDVSMTPGESDPEDSETRRRGNNRVKSGRDRARFDPRLRCGSFADNSRRGG